jgi:hypothetical protein
VRDDAHEREEERLELSRFVDCADEGGGRPAGRGRPRAVEELKGELPPNEQHRGREAAYSRARADTMCGKNNADDRQEIGDERQDVWHAIGSNRNNMTSLHRVHMYFGRDAQLE